MTFRELAAPRGYAIEDNKLYNQIRLMNEQFRLVNQGQFKTMAVVGPPGLGKTYGADKYLRGNGKRLIKTRSNATNMTDVLRKYRGPENILCWDDTNYLFKSEPSMAILAIATDTKAVPTIPDDRPGKHGFPFLASNVLVTNKNLFDPKLADFDKNLRDIIRPLFESRFQLRSFLTFDLLQCYHFACWIGTDGGNMLGRVLSPNRNTLSLDQCNEVLEWFQTHAHRLNEISPRRLNNIAEIRLKAPKIWEAICQQYLLPNDGVFMTRNGQPMAPIPATERWVMQRPERNRNLIMQVPPSRTANNAPVVPSELLAAPSPVLT